MFYSMYRYIIIIITATQLLALPPYIVGGQLSEADQEISFNICHPEFVENSFRLADYNGALNGGHYKVVILDIETSW